MPGRFVGRVMGPEFRPKMRHRFRGEGLRMQSSAPSLSAIGCSTRDRVPPPVVFTADAKPSEQYADSPVQHPPERRRARAGPAGSSGPALDVRGDDIDSWRILRKSLDVRDKSDLRFRLYRRSQRAAGRTPTGRAARPALRSRSSRAVPEPPFEMPQPGSEPLAERPVIIGSGPAGTLAACFLAEQGYRPLVLERGRAVRERIRDMRAFEAGGPHKPESNYLFGEGGAGTFSDGKLTCRSSGPDVRRVLEVLAECKGKPSILYDYRPHLGSNRLPAVVKALRQRIEAARRRVALRVPRRGFRSGRRPGARAGDIVGLSSPRSVVVLAIGHSARDTYEMLLARGVPMVAKPFQIGRADRAAAGAGQSRAIRRRPAWKRRLGAADYSLVARGRHDVFTFCMCAGGQVMPSVSRAGLFLPPTA